MNRKVMITGATSGFGLEIARRFAAEGDTLILTGRRRDRLDRIARELTDQSGVPVTTCCFDIRDRKAVSEALTPLLQSGAAPIDILVNNAGLAAGMAPIDEGEIDDWEQMIDTNVKGLLYVTRAIAPSMRARRSGHIINIGSTAGDMAYRNGNVYCATKFAVDALSQSMRIDLLPYNIKVTAINPGMAETEFSLVRFKGDAERAQSVYEGFQPLTASDVADAVLYTANLPAHVCINDLTLTCLTQANAFYSIKADPNK